MTTFVVFSRAIRRSIAHLRIRNARSAIFARIVFLIFTWHVIWENSIDEYGNPRGIGWEWAFAADYDSKYNIN